jgi:hypothetical protein
MSNTHACGMSHTRKVIFISPMGLLENKLMGVGQAGHLREQYNRMAGDGKEESRKKNCSARAHIFLSRQTGPSSFLHQKNIAFQL